MDDNIYSAPKAGLDTLPPNGPERPESRGGCLTAFLLFGLVANAFTSIMYVYSLMQGTMFGQPLPPHWAVVALSIGAAMNVVSCFAVWQWRRWGVYSFLGMAAVSLGINLAIGVPMVGIAMGLLGVVILALLVRPIWRYMR